MTLINNLGLVKSQAFMTFFGHMLISPVLNNIVRKQILTRNILKTDILRSEGKMFDMSNMRN